jgi:hypothetical protein
LCLISENEKYLKKYLENQFQFLFSGPLLDLVIEVMELISVTVPSSSYFFSSFCGLELIISYSSWTGTCNGTENKS